jgi:hypothetical protein
MWVIEVKDSSGKYHEALNVNTHDFLAVCTVIVQHFSCYGHI